MPASLVRAPLQALLLIAVCSACSSNKGGETGDIGSIAGSSGSTAIAGVGVVQAGGAGAISAAVGGAGATAPTTTGAAGASGSAAAGSGGRSGAGGSAVAGTGAAAAGAAGEAGAAGAAGSTVADVECNPADKTADAKPVTGLGTGAKPSGEFSVVVESDPGIADHTVYRPDPIGMIKHPILAWGNGGCSKDSSGFAEFLMQLTSQGILVIADGTPGGTGSGSLGTDGTVLLKAIDWATAENERPCSKYYHKLDVSKVAVSGQSCGGLMAIGASTDKRITTSMPMNSGLFSRDMAIYGALHAPMAIIDGGPDDIAYENGSADFMAINNIPLLFANSPTGHGGTYWEDNGGEFGKVAVGWLRWWLLSDLGATGKGMFIGEMCGLCGNTNWSLMWKMKPQ
ncbi:MAG TPA: hypothetical protein VFG30_21885 [Polyangiales bacterium]|nr:hypothetical protein [Polyangiales bacterium]